MLIFYFLCCPFPFPLSPIPFFLSQFCTYMYYLVYILHYFSPFSYKPYAWVCMQTHTNRQIYFTLYLNPTMCFRLWLEK